VSERFSGAARRALRAVAQAPFTAFHDLEVRNAFELLLGRRLITSQERRAIDGHLAQDLDSRRLVPTPLDLDRVFADASELSREHSARILSRSLDLLHVAAALGVQCRRFVSADDRQLAVAKAAGLATIDIKGRRQGS